MAQANETQIMLDDLAHAVIHTALQVSLKSAQRAIAAHNNKPLLKAAYEQEVLDILRVIARVKKIT